MQALAIEVGVSTIPRMLPLVRVCCQSTFERNVMNAKLLRVGLTIINVASGIGLLVAAIQIQAVPILAQTYENCEYDEESYCDEGEACCDDTC